MAYVKYGAVMPAWVVSSVPADDVLGPGIEALVLPTAPSTLDIRDGENGPVVTDFLDESGAPATEIVIPAGDPYIPGFSVQDTVTPFVQAANGRWLRIPPFEEAAGGGGGTDPGAVQLAGGNITTITDDAVFFQRIDIQSSTGSSPNRWGLRYWDANTSTWRWGLHANEKGLLRVRGVTKDDVPARIMAHPTQDAQWPVLEVTGDNSQAADQKYLQVFEHKVVSVVDLHVTWLTFPTGERLTAGTANPADSPLYLGKRPNIGDGWLDYNNPGGA